VQREDTQTLTPILTKIENILGFGLSPQEEVVPRPLTSLPKQLQKPVRSRHNPLKENVPNLYSYYEHKAS